MHAYYFVAAELLANFDRMEDSKSQYVSIHPEFYSFHLGSPFDKCLECEKELIVSGADYVIEKSFRQFPEYGTKDTVFDYAICMECAGRLQRDLSKESLKAITDFMEKNVNIQQREQAVLQAKGDVTKMIDRCMIENTERGECNEYQIFAYCKGNQINLQMPPYMLSGPVLHEISELLSDSTRENFNDFFNKHFSPAPGLMEPDPKLILF